MDNGGEHILSQMKLSIYLLRHQILNGCLGSESEGRHDTVVEASCPQASNSSGTHHVQSTASRQDPSDVSQVLFQLQLQYWHIALSEKKNDKSPRKPCPPHFSCLTSHRRPGRGRENPCRPIAHSTLHAVQL